MRAVNEILNATYSIKSHQAMKTSYENKVEEKIGLGKSDCLKCGGLGYIVPDVEAGHPDFGRAKICGCRNDELERARSFSLLKLSDIGALRHYTFEQFIPEGRTPLPSQKDSIRKALEAAVEYSKKPVGWLVLKGGYGCGKTHLAAAIANSQLDQKNSVLFVNTPDLLDHLRATFNPDSTVSYDERFEQVRSSPLLILDDLGAQSNSEWAQEKLYQLINHRYIEALPTVITTNIDEESLDARLRSRLSHKEWIDENGAKRGLVKTVEIDAPDFRRGGIEADDTELSTLQLYHDKTFDSFDTSRNERFLEKEQKDNIVEAKRVAKLFAEHPEGWLTFSSVGSGNGKTHLAAAIANQVSESGTPVLFVGVPDLLDYFRASFAPNSTTMLDKRLDQVKKVDLLVLDDLGTESATAWAREKLYQLFNYRYITKRATVITTNLKVDELDPRLASRMLDGKQAIFFAITVPGYGGSTKQVPKTSSQRRR